MRLPGFHRSLVSVVALTAGLLVVAAAAGRADARPAVATAPGAFVGLTPARVLDTRTGVGAAAAPLQPGQAHTLQMTGFGGVPYGSAGAQAVVLTLTVTRTTSSGYLSVYPTGGGSPPTTSVVNWVAGQTVAGQATVTLGGFGSVDVLVRGGRAADVVVDVTGYIVPGTARVPGAYVAGTPTRLLDTRSGTGAPRARLGAGQLLRVQVAGRGPVPATGASAVVATLTAVDPAGSGFLTAWPGLLRPVASSLNYAKGRTVANQVTVPLGTGGTIDVYADGGPVDVLLDVTGYVIAGTAVDPGTYVPLTPRRILDTRQTGNRPPGTPFPLSVAEIAEVPDQRAGAAVVNLTVTATTSPGYLSAWPRGRTRPVASALNWATGQTVANQASIALGDQGDIDLVIAAATTAAVVVDIAGYYLGTPPPPPTDLFAAPERTAVTLTWHADPDAQTSFLVRRVGGSTPPSAVTDGVVVATSGNSARDVGLNPGSTYSYAVFASDPVPNYSPPAVVTVTTFPAAAPSPVVDTDLTADADATAVTLHWTPPTDASYATSVVRRSTGGTPPATPEDGTASGTGFGTLRVTGLRSASRYSFTVFARDTAGRISAGVSATVTTVGVVVGTARPVTPAAGLSPHFELSGLDCANASGCLGVGTTFADGTARAVVASGALDAASLAAAPAPLPADAVSDGASRLSRLACASPVRCAAIGSYTATDGEHPFVLTWSGTVATPHRVDLPAAAGDPALGFGDLDCGSATTCQAVGRYRAADGGAGLATMVVVGSAVTVQQSTIPRTFADPEVDALSCASATSCAAVGSWDVTHGLLGTWNGRTWRWTDAPLSADAVGGFTTVHAVDCATSTSCRAIGSALGRTGAGRVAITETWDGTGWTPAVVPAARTDNYGGVVACPDATTCFASYSSEESQVVVLGAGSSVVRELPDVTPTNVYARAVYGLACVSRELCAMSGTSSFDGGAGRRYGALYAVTPTTVAGADVPVPAGVDADDDVNIGTTACSDATHCFAAGWTQAPRSNDVIPFVQPFTLVGG